MGASQGAQNAGYGRLRLFVLSRVPERIVSAAGLQLVLADSFDGWQLPCVVENCLARAVGPEYWPERTSWRTFDPPLRNGYRGTCPCLRV